MKYLCLSLLLLPFCLFGQSESDYIKLLSNALGGQREVAVPNGRVDILTDSYAIEVERASKWKNSIGQALWYALQTQKEPGIILLMESPQDFIHLQRLNSALDYAGLGTKVQTWIYPNDFPGITLPDNQSTNLTSPAPSKTNYWLTASSKKRHNNHCEWYEKSRGRYCNATEGTPAGCCH